MHPLSSFPAFLLDPRKARFALACVFMVSVAAPLHGQVNALRLPSVTLPSSSGSTVQVTCQLEHNLLGLAGFQFGILPQSPLMVTAASSIGPLISPDTDFVQVSIVPGGGVTVGVIYDTMAIATLPPGAYDVLRLTVDATSLMPGQSRTLEFRGDLGNPMVIIQFFGLPGFTVIPASQITQVNGVISRQPEPPPAVIGSSLWIPLRNQDEVVRVDFPTQSLVGPFSGPAGLLEPTAVAVDRTGTAWVAYEGSGDVVRYVPVGPGLLPFIASSIQLGGHPSAITFDRAGNAWVADRMAHTISKIGDGGTPTLSGSSAVVLVGEPIALAVDQTDSLWVATAGATSTLTRVNGNGLVTLAISLPGDPGALVIDRAGFLWVTLPNMDRIERRSSDGAFVTCWQCAPSASPTQIAIRNDPTLFGGREAWVTGSSGSMGATFGFWRLRLDDPGNCRNPTFIATTAAAPLSGVTIDGMGRIWGPDPAGGDLFGLDSTGMPLAPITGLGLNPGFSGDASGYVQANVLHPGCARGERIHGSRWRRLPQRGRVERRVRCV